MKKLLVLLLTCATAATLLIGCGSKEETSSTTTESTETETTTESETNDTVSITHSLGTAEVTKNPQKVVVFDFGTLDTLDELAIDAKLALPQDNLPDYLSKYSGSDYTNAGGIKEPDLEAINAFEPELIIIAGRQSDYYEDLSAIAPTLYIEIDSTKYMENFKKNVGWIAEIFEKESEAEAKIAAIETQIEEINTTIDPAKKALIVLTNDGGISAYGSGSRFGIIHDVFGVTPVDESIDVSTHGQEVNYEYISEQNPDIIFVVDRTAVVGGETTETAPLDNELVNATTAATNDQIISLDPNVWYLSGGGLQSVQMMADEIAAAFK